MSATENKERNRFITVIIAALWMVIPSLVLAQGSPLTVKPSSGQVGVNVTDPQYTLDVGTGTVNAGFFRGNGSQLTNLPSGGGGTGGYGSRGQFSKNSTGAPDNGSRRGQV